MAKGRKKNCPLKRWKLTVIERPTRVNDCQKKIAHSKSLGILPNEYANPDTFLINSPNQSDNFHDLLINSPLLRVQPARERILTFMALILVLIKISRLPWERDKDRALFSQFSSASIISPRGSCDAERPPLSYQSLSSEENWEIGEKFSQGMLKALRPSILIGESWPPTEFAQ